MRVFAAGIQTETNTFSPIPTAEDDFVITQYNSNLPARANPMLEQAICWKRQSDAAGYNFLPGLIAFAQPGGPTTRKCYEGLRDRLTAQLRAALPVDIVLLNLHGAMIADGYQDCERDLISAVREIVGSETVIAVLFDLHCHLSEEKISAVDIVLLYKEYPHVDMNERAAALFELATATKLGAIRPTMALSDCKITGFLPTSREPMAGFVTQMKAAERREGVLGVSLGHGFPLGDVPHQGAKMLVMTHANTEAAQEIAEEFRDKLWAIREQVCFHSIVRPLDEALSLAVASPMSPVVVADQADNVGGGAPGDSTSALRWMVSHDVKSAAIAILHDPEAVKIVRKAGIGASLQLRLGGKLCSFSGEPLDLAVQVNFVQDEYSHAFPQADGTVLYFPVGDTVAVGSHGIDIIIGSERCQCFSPSIFSDFGIDPQSKHLLVVKSMQHFYDAFARISDRVIYMAGPGAVSPDPRVIPYVRFDPHGHFPWR